ncbi:MAG TPA: hypothetical protein PKA31_03230 [Candidatus Moranbacteria bacterium]|nr:hypothetical protein [Candidatus Moranbacteria bacterium]
MDISLDLLPVQRKQELRRARIFRMLVREQAVFLLPLLMFIGILGGVVLVLKTDQQSVISAGAMGEGQGQFQELKVFEEEFQRTNDSVERIMKMEKAHLHWSRALRDLGRLLPQGAIVSELSTKDYTVMLRGKAKTREDLLSLKSALEGYGCAENVQVPLSNLVSRTDVEFQVDFTLKKECLLEQ